MNYEEYADRTKRQGRKPVEIEHYEECIEVAYMALGDVDKDEFCRLSDKTITAIRMLADRVEKAEKSARDAEARAQDAAFHEQKAQEREAETDKKLVEAMAKIDQLAEQISERNTLLEDLVADMSSANVVRFMLNR